MKRWVGPAIALAGALAFAAADAQTLRCAGQGDPQTMDPALAERVHEPHDERPGLRAPDRP